MAAPFGFGSRFPGRQHISTDRGGNPCHPSRKQTLNPFPDAGARIEMPVERTLGSSEQPYPESGFATNAFRTLNNRALGKPPPPVIPDALVRQDNTDQSPYRFPNPTQNFEGQEMQQNMNIFSPNFPPPRLPPPFSQQPFSSNMNSIVSFPISQQVHVKPNVLNNFQEVKPGPTYFPLDAPSSEAITQAQEDRKWLDEWLNKVKERPCQLQSQHSYNLSEVQMKTRQMLVLIAKLQKQKQILETLKDEDKSIWDQKVLEIERVKSELEQLQSYLTSDDTVAKLQKKIVLRKKKRERLKRHRREKYEQYCEELEQRERKHNEIDRNLDKIHQKEKDAKQEKDLQKEVDTILGQVKKKLTENSRAIQLLQGLEKLRQMRKDRQERQGIHVMGWANDHTFSTKVESLRTMLQKQEQVYKAEESALKVILETEQEETREKEREKDRQREIERQKREEKRVEHALFGTYKEPRPDDPLYPFKQYYEAASHSFEAFINIRHEWDKYLVLEGTPGGSRIPEDWVLPPEPSSDTWASALQDR